MRTPTLFLFFASAALCAAQTITDGNLSVCSSTNGCASTGMTLSNLTYVNSTTTIYGVPFETRKDDHKGPTIRQVKLSAKNWDGIVLAPADYIVRAKRISLDSGAVEEAQILQAVHDAHLKVYDFASVDSYLFRQALKQGANYRWVWEPMREKDTKFVLAANVRQTDHAGYVDNQQYQSAIPDHVLADVERFMDCAPEDTIYLVSDYRAVNPDPFLAVTTVKMLAAGRILIIDQWDEPGFKDKGDEAERVILTVQK
jgi:hypothetical protein